MMSDDHAACRVEAARLLARAHTAEGRVQYLESMQQAFLSSIDSLAHAFPEANRRKILDWLDTTTLIRDARSKRIPRCGYCQDRPSSLVPCPECDS